MELRSSTGITGTEACFCLNTARAHPSSMATVEEEIIHWWKDDKGESHRNALRIESEPTSEYNGFPRDGVVTLRIMNTVSQQAIKLSPDEALRISTQLLSVAKDLLNQKRQMWNHHED